MSCKLPLQEEVGGRTLSTMHFLESLLLIHYQLIRFSVFIIICELNLAAAFSPSKQFFKFFTVSGLFGAGKLYQKWHKKAIIPSYEYCKGLT